MGTKRKTSKVVKRRKSKKPKKVNSLTARRQVFHGKRVKSNGGLQKQSFMMNKRGRVVSKKLHAKGVKLFKKNLSGWNKAFLQARKNLNIEGFVACKKGSKLYKETMRLYKN